MTTIGQLLYTRRHALEMSLEALSNEMGGAPSPSYLWRVEAELSTASATTCIRISKALRLPEDLVLNMAGHATAKQQQAAVDKIVELIGGVAPMPVTYIVYDSESSEPTLEKVAHIMSAPQSGFVVRLSGQPDPIFNGECVVVNERPSVEGAGVVIKRNGRLISGRYYADWIERGDEKITKNYEMMGVIRRVIHSTDL